MFSYLLSLMMTVSPMAAGGNGHHWGWRNQATTPPPPPPVTLVSHPGGSSPGPSYGNPGGDPNPNVFKFGN